MRDPHLIPARWFLAAAVFVMLALPVLSAFGVTPVGGFRMFAEPLEYRIELETRAARGTWIPLPMSALLPHVGRGAKRTLAHSDRFRPGGAQAHLVAGGLEDLADLACQLRPTAEQARAAVYYRAVSEGSTPAARTVVVECRQGR